MEPKDEEQHVKSPLLVRHFLISGLWNSLTAHPAFSKLSKREVKRLLIEWLNANVKD